jgi:acetyl esterase/lipase
MKKTFTFLCLTFLIHASLSAQIPCDVITNTPSYTCIDTIKNVKYGEGKHDYFFPDPNNGCAPFESLFTDIFRPCPTIEPPRPLVIFIHGGAFAAGNKSDFWAQCNAFARRGFIAATIQYRLSASAFSFNRRDLIRAGFRAQQDAKAAVRFFKANAAQFNIDTANIFMLGYSAGAVTALNVVYARDEDERPVEANADPTCGDWFGCPICPDLGALEGVGGNPDFSSQIKGVYSMAGAVMDMALMDVQDDAPVFMIHGTNDQTVNYDSACFLNLNPCPKLFGSNSLRKRGEELGLCTQLHTLPGAGHDLTLYAAVITDEAAAFFKQLFCDDNPCNVSSVAGNGNENLLKAFPNPAVYLLNVELPPGSDGVLLLSDFTGKTVLSHLLEPGMLQAQLSLESLPAGVYFLQLAATDGSRQQAAKIFKAR